VGVVGGPVERVDDEALVAAAGVRAALLAQDRRARKGRADPRDDQRLAGTVGVGDQVVGMLFGDLARGVEPLAQEGARVASERGDERERVQRSAPGSARG
jgi:hypothetical protein